MPRVGLPDDDIKRAARGIERVDTALTVCEENLEHTEAERDAYVDLCEGTQIDLKRADKVIEAARQDIAEARATCGGDGTGCEAMINAHHATPARRWARCGACPMDALTATLQALRAYDGEAGN